MQLNNDHKLTSSLCPKYFKKKFTTHSLAYTVTLPELDKVSLRQKKVKANQPTTASRLWPMLQECWN